MRVNIQILPSSTSADGPRLKGLLFLIIAIKLGRADGLASVLAASSAVAAAAFSSLPAFCSSSPSAPSPSAFGLLFVKKPGILMPPIGIFFGFTSRPSPPDNFAGFAGVDVASGTLMISSLTVESSAFSGGGVSISTVTVDGDFGVSGFFAAAAAAAASALAPNNFSVSFGSSAADGEDVSLVPFVAGAISFSSSSPIIYRSDVSEKAENLVKNGAQILENS